MDELKGVILAGSATEEDELVQRLNGRSRYAMPLANRALVRYGAEALAACGIEEVIVAVCPRTTEDVGELIGNGARYGARFVYLEHAVSDSALDVLLAASEMLGDCPLIVHSGDAVVTGGLSSAVADWRRTRPDVLLVSEPARSAEPAIIGARPGSHPALAGGLDHVSPAAIVSAGALQKLDGFTADTATLGGTAAALAEAGVNVSSRAPGGCWCYSPHCDHLLEANRMILDELVHKPPEIDQSTARIEGRVVIHPSARVDRTTIRGPAVIGGDVELMDTFIGPYTSIGAGARLDGAEIEHSIVLAGATIGHLGRRIEASVIGSGAEISRDFGMPAAVRLRVGNRSEVTLS